MKRKVVHATGPKIAIVYCRVSTRNQQDEGTSLETQEAACREHALALGYQIGRVTKEVYSGAELWDRPELSRDRAAIKAGEFQALIVYSTDRLSRDPIHLAIIADDCERANGELIFVTEPLDSSPEGALIRYVKGYASQIEREKIKERTMRGRHARLQSGKPGFGGWQLYGYEANREEGRYEIVEQEALIVLRIFEMCASGLGCHKIASTLNREGVPSPKVWMRPGVKWCSATLYRMLKSESYKGEESQGRTKRVTYFDQNQKKNRDVPRPRSEWIKLPDGTRPAIVSSELWESVQERLKVNAGEAARNRERPVLLRGLIFCGGCGRRMIRNEFRRGKYHYNVYRCSSHWRQYQTGCKGKGVDVEAADEFVWSNVKSVFTDPTIIERELKRLEEQEKDSQLEAQLETLRRELKRIESGIQSVIHRFRNDPALGAAVEREIKVAAKERQHLEALIARLESQLDANTRAAVDMRSLADHCQQVAKRLDKLAFNERRLALAALGVRVVGNGSDWRLELKVPTQPTPDVISLRASAHD